VEEAGPGGKGRHRWTSESLYTMVGSVDPYPPSSTAGGGWLLEHSSIPSELRIVELKPARPPRVKKCQKGARHGGSRL
jgi:hypothetical protein